MKRKASRVFPGWYVVGASFCAHIAYGVHFNSILGIFLKSMGTEFGLSRTTFSLVQTIARVFEGLFALIIGPILDRRGARQVIVLGGIVSGVSYLLLSRATEGWHLVVVVGVFSSFGMLALSGMVTSVAVSNWFVRKRGRAIGIAAMGNSAGSIIWPILITLLILGWNWRWAWVMMGLASFVLVIPAAIFVRRRPEDMGLRPDGQAEPAPQPPSSAKASPSRKGSVPDSSPEEWTWTRREVLKSASFWLIVFTLGVASMGMVGINFHLFPIVTDKGVSETLAATVLSFRALTMFGVNPLWGLIAERVDVRLVAMAKCLVQAVGVLLFMVSGSLPLLYLAMFVLGVGWGGTGVVQEVIWANYYGRRSLGLVRSLGFPLSVLFSALGPIFLGVVWDITESYNIAFIVVMGLSLFSAFAILLCRPPKKKALPT